MKALLTTLLLIAAFNVNADTSLILGMKSYHFSGELRERLNQNNPSIGVKYNNVQAVFVSKNSWNEKSLYLTYNQEFKINNYISLTGDLGIATGYKCSNSVRVNVKDGYRTYHNTTCSNSGILPLYAVGFDFSPLANNFALSVSVNHSVAMFSTKYKF